ncbi:MAG: hypothetical protein KDB79_09035 [Acidobacteria bacterium]|nr:hypothetical protein [Acidobacteriota bacterium]
MLIYDPPGAIAEQNRVKQEFSEAFRRGLICRRFEKHDEVPGYLLFDS